MAEGSPWRTALRDNQEFLEETLVFRDIRAMLLQERVISDRDSARIIQKGNSFDQIAELVEVMRTKDAKAYCSFLESLKGLAGQGHIYKTLNRGCSAEKAKKWDKEQNYSESPEETPESQPVTASQDKVRLEEMISILGNKGIKLEDLDMEKASEQLIKYVGKNECYEIKSSSRGRALIISNAKFEVDALDDIETNDYDAQVLQTVLDDLHFDTSIEWNKTAKEIHEILLNERRSQPSMPDAFVLVVLSHGGQRFIYGTDGTKIYLETEGDNPGIYSYFYNDNCGALDGKPKMFFIQACQSENKSVQPTDDTEDVRSTAVPVNPTQENGTAVPVNLTEEDVTAVPVNLTEEDVTAVPVNQTEEDVTAVPVNPDLEDVSAVSANAYPDAVLSTLRNNPNRHAHMVKFISACPGDKAFADEDLGGWFIRALVVVLKKCAHDTDILEMCNIIQHILGKLRDEDGANQMALYTHTFCLRKFYFLPGYKPQNPQHPKDN